ncbi:BolA family protein [Rickettsiales endosymbiont of Stachyamoeba lipophora]|uniref:BolA family protein n=1 Tax=Rickettsiales endosymbiont of Stachyamoeba lipophora TaxID=2486578 RepID=UPI000F650F77|nr:BolA/IbaG family iron-sulfur metabolism protein [Rickettsiales endosymbiont of Stachyamoeba lipophora]AZL15178.1 BolA/IbaG family iron-sulfur metabolism protein [Rickettsiales endosymbiont of Stachyamoeba lipophora]
MPVSKEYLDDKLKIYFGNEASWEIIDLAGDNDHYELIITSTKFTNKPRVIQHKMVNDALKECLGGQLHALKITTKPA